MKHQPDGKWRGARQAVVVSETVVRARWIEAETIQLKRKCCNFEGCDGEHPERNWAARSQAGRSNSWSMN
jgi:hypothetical protein